MFLKLVFELDLDLRANLPSTGGGLAFAFSIRRFGTFARAGTETIAELALATFRSDRRADSLEFNEHMHRRCATR